MGVGVTVAGFDCGNQRRVTAWGIVTWCCRDSPGSDLLRRDMLTAAGHGIAARHGGGIGAGHVQVLSRAHTVPSRPYRPEWRSRTGVRLC